MNRSTSDPAPLNGTNPATLWIKKEESVQGVPADRKCLGFRMTQRINAYVKGGRECWTTLTVTEKDMIPNTLPIRKGDGDSST
jgi:hypothetical protein